jgi:hypothetical protein
MTLLSRLILPLLLPHLSLLLLYRKWMRKPTRKIQKKKMKRRKGVSKEKKSKMMRERSMREQETSHCCRYR